MSRSFGVLNALETVALRATFLIDRTGVIRHASCNDLGIGRSVEETLRILRAVRVVDESGGEAVCPVDWVPGGKVINPRKSQEFFSKQ
jgi:alkyl hydroperoxide reductase subunit AhpC